MGGRSRSGPTPVPGDLWPLAGREDELQLVSGWLESGSRPHVVLAGSPGVGKSRLAAEVLALLRARGWLTKHTVATHAAAGIPFGPVVGLLPQPDVLASGPLDILRRAGRALQEEAGGRRLAVCVDDAHLLDGASAALLHQLAVAGAASVFVTVRVGHQAPEPITTLWKDGVARRVDLQPLADAEIGFLLREVLGGHLDRGTVRHLADACEGNILYLQELVSAGISSGAIAESDGVWRLRGPIDPGLGLRELIEERLEQLAPGERRLLQLLALTEPLEVDILETICGPELVREAEAAGLIALAPPGRREQVRVVHPLYAEVLRKATPPLQAGALVRPVADTLEARGAGDAGALLRAAVLRMRSGQPVAAGTVLAATRRALELGDFALAERLAGLGIEANAGGLAHVMLGEALVGQHREADAERVLASVVTASDAETAQAVLVRAANLSYGVGRIEDAERVLEQAQRTITDASCRAEITATRALLVAAHSSGSAGLELARSVIELPGTRPRALARAYVAAADSLCFSGRTGESLRLLDEAVDRLLAGEEASTFLRLMLIGSRWRALWLAGRVGEAAELAAAEQQLALRDGREADRGYWVFQAGIGDLVAGWLVSAIDHLREAVAISRTSDPMKVLTPALASLAQALALAGDVESARAAIEAARPSAHLHPPQEEAWVRLAHAWVTAAAGELGTARNLAAEAARTYRRVGHYGLEVVALQAVARLGAPASVVVRVQEIAAACEGLLLPAIATHVAALRSGDAVALEWAARGFDTLGLPLLAGETALHAALGHARAGKAASARAWQHHGRELLEACGATRVPALPNLEARDPLTQREREVAGLAAQRLTSPQIAERLRISVRTVDNHLQQVYAKLEVRGRGELETSIRSGDAS